MSSATKIGLLVGVTALAAALGYLLYAGRGLSPAEAPSTASPPGWPSISGAAAPSNRVGAPAPRSPRAAARSSTPSTRPAEAEPDVTPRPMPAPPRATQRAGSSDDDPKRAARLDLVRSFREQLAAIRQRVAALTQERQRLQREGGTREQLNAVELQIRAAEAAEPRMKSHLERVERELRSAR